MTDPETALTNENVIGGSKPAGSCDAAPAVGVKRTESDERHFRGRIQSAPLFHGRRTGPEADRSGWAATKNRLKELKASFAPRYKTVLWKSSGVAARISRRALSSVRPAPAISSRWGNPPLAG